MEIVIENFHFIRPYWLLALFGLALSLWLLVRNKSNNRAWSMVCDASLLPYILANKETNSRRWSLYVIGLVGVIAIISMAGPAWQKTPEPVFRSQSALVIVLDLSLSMNAEDVKPNRLARAKHKVIDILRKREEGQTALIVYALESFIVSPLTQDNKTIEQLVPTLSAELMPSQGSKTSLALIMANDLLRQAGMARGNVILVTDSVSRAEAKNSITKLTENGYQLSILGVGTAEGAPISLPGGGFLKDRSGAIVIPKLNESALKKIAAEGIGRYASLAADDSDVNALLSDMNNNFYDEEIENKKLKLQADTWEEEGPLLLLLILPFVALYFRRGWLVAIFIIVMPFPQTSYAIDWQNLWSNSDQKAQTLFKEGNHELATKHFKNEQWKAAAEYRSGNYDKALASLQQLDDAESLYNKGNALAKLGKLEEAVQSYNEAIKQNPENEDAIYNRDLVMEKMKQQDKDQDSKQQDPNKDKGDNKDKKNQSGSSEQQDKSDQNSQQQDSDENAQNEDQKEKNSKNSNDDMSEQQEQKEKSAQNKSEQDKQDAKEKSEQSQLSEEEKKKGEQSEQQIANKDSENESNEKNEEKKRIVQQWLRRIPDDPGGLLRRKFRYQSQVQGGQVQGAKPW